MANGLFISFEGGEGAGKSTLIETVYQELYLSNYTPIKTYEPGGTDLGEKLREILLHSKDPIAPYSELGLFLAARAEHVEKVILPSLKKGKIVLTDRFHDSTIAYQGIARGLGKKKVHELCLIFSQSIEPDITFYLDLDPSIGFSRKEKLEKDRIEKETMAFHQKVRSAFLELAEDFPNRMHVLDASLPPHETAQIVIRSIFHKL